jgi:S-adenosylmethionine:tRNA ribosyltransferase-isomerase
LNADHEQNLLLSNYDYPLPQHLIAKYPLFQRDVSRMMVLNRAQQMWEHRHFYNLVDYLEPGDLVVVNNTKVLPARLLGHRQGYTGKVELLLLHPQGDDPNRWSALMKPKRKLKPGTIVEFPGTASIAVIETDQERGQGDVSFQLKDFDSVPQMLEAIGHIPIPPYLSRESEESDKETYQTVYAKVPGSQAAPTAGLHFTPQVMEALKAKGIAIEEVTLNVSSGTFRSVYDDDIRLHQMDPEYYTVSEATVQAVLNTKANGKRVFAIGTTVAKTLETVASKFNGKLQADADWSRLFIYPGFQFQVIDGMLTNFHLPKTTLLMLISALAGRELILSAYKEAVAQEYRFFSYGDCMLIQ